MARVEDRTFICSENRDPPSGPTTGGDPAEMKRTMTEPDRRSMRGRTMYVVPFSMGPLGSAIAHTGVELTDSGIRDGEHEDHDPDGTGRPRGPRKRTESWSRACIRSAPRSEPGEADVPWPCNADTKYIAHFPETREIWWFGSGYGGNALFGKKCYALRIASVMAQDDGWLAEHMLILKLTSPEERSRYITGAFPSACGKTNLAMLIPTLPGWKVETIGDDICWMKFGSDGRLWAINPSTGSSAWLRGPAEDQPQCHAHPGRRLRLHQHRPHRRRRRVVGRHDRREASAPHRLARSGLDAGVDHTAAHPNARFTAPASQDPAIAPEWEDPTGVPISAILFGGRRSSVVPLDHRGL